MEFLGVVAFETLRTFYLAAPFILFGLLMAGLLHVCLPESVIQRFMGRPGMRGVTWAALVGVPLPVCSCGVVPISVELRRKGASQASSLSFLTTTPESSIDSILFTWGLMGPVLAVARPVAAFFSAVLGGGLAILVLDEAEPKPAGEVGEDACSSAEGGSCATDDACSPSLSHPQAATALLALRGLFGRRPADGEERPGVWKALVRPTLRYGFVELIDDLAFWLVLGVLLAGLLGALMPADLGAWGLGEGILPMLLLLVVGVPLYMCASASTPIAAALLAKGVSPGAALVFLLAGPATNAATLVLLTRTFGRRFVGVYLASVVTGALVSGLALDAVIVRFSLEIAMPLRAPGESALTVLEWAAVALLGTLVAMSFRRGSGRTGLRELKESFTSLLPRRADAA